MCSNTFGPAKEPSLVICPTRKTGTLFSFANFINSAVHCLIWDTLPAADSTIGDCKVWIESITTNSGVISLNCWKIFEGDRHLSYRILRTTKNRFGSTSELGIYEMLGAGLREVSNPSEILLSQRNAKLSGIAIGATMEGNRPLLIEIQSLVSVATYGNPQRSSTGFDNRRLQMLLAVLEKRGGFKLSQQDVFLNIAGGIKVEDPAMDLAVCTSIISSYEEVIMPTDVAFTGEVGLGGEVRAVNRIDSRISEAAKLGFRKIFISKNNMKGLEIKKFDITIIPVSMLNEVLDSLV